MHKTGEIIVIGAGLSGLSAAHFLRKYAPAKRVLLLEKSDRPGGAVRSYKAQGYLAEWGPHGFLDNNQDSRELLVDTDLVHLSQKAPLSNFVRYVCHNGRLVPLPQKPTALLTTKLLSPAGKIRLLGDLFKKTILEEQSAGQWARHRFGQEILPLVDAAITGTFAGDYQKLSIDAIMPGLRVMEKEYGSVLKGIIAKKKNGGSSGRLPAMTSFPEGMEQLISTLATKADIRYNCGVGAISQTQNTWLLKTSCGRFETQNLLIALPVNQTLRLLAEYEPPVPSIPEARIATVALGFKADSAKVPFGFGYLAPEKEKRFTMGALFSTHMFPGRAPKGMVLLEALAGGRRHPERLELSDDELIRYVYEDIRELISLPAPPCFSKVLRNDFGIPQLEMGYPALLAWKKRLEERIHGLQICGFGWDGIGMNEMMKHAKTAADKIIRHAASTQARPELKAIYF